MRIPVLDIQASAAFVRARRPVLEPFLRTFLPLLERRQKVTAKLAANFKDSEISLPAFQPAKSAAGVPLLSGQSLGHLQAQLQFAAAEMLPVLTELPPLKDHRDILADFFQQEMANKVFEAILLGDEKTIATQAEVLGVPPQVLNFAGELILSPVLRALTSLAASENGTFPWDTEGTWNQGYCPVCGNFPVIAWLDKPKVDKQNAFLAGGGGKKHFHCALCGGNWQFKRNVCPACDASGDGAMEILREVGSHGERLDLCKQCHTYCPTLDLRELIDIPDMDVMALGMLHLDMLASRKGLKPLKPSFWNTF